MAMSLRFYVNLLEKQFNVISDSSDITHRYFYINNTSDTVVGIISDVKKYHNIDISWVKKYEDLKILKRKIKLDKFCEKASNNKSLKHIPNTHT